MLHKECCRLFFLYSKINSIYIRVLNNLLNKGKIKRREKKKGESIFMDRFDNAPVGIFDSGVGGLTVAREIARQIPNESFVYFGDTARVPYGSKSKETIIRYSRQCFCIRYN